MPPTTKTAQYKQSVCWWCFAQPRGKMQPEALVKAAAAIGFASFEIVPREHWSLVTDHNLRIAAVGGHGAFTDGLNRRENHSRIEDELWANIELAAQHNIPNLICFSGNRGEMSDDEGLENTARGLQRVARAAESKKVTLIIELLNSKVNHPGYQADRTSWGVEVCRRVNSPSVKLLYDIYHMQIMEGDLIRTIQQNIAYIGHFHTAGNPGRADLDNTQEINYDGIARAIAATGYAGFIGHEFTPKGSPVPALRRAFKMFDI